MTRNKTIDLPRLIHRALALGLFLFGLGCEEIKPPQLDEKSEADSQEGAEDEIAAAECLHHLTTFLEEEADPESFSKNTEALLHYQRFWEEHGYDSPFSAKIAVAGIPVMRKAGRIDEAILHLHRAIHSVSKMPETPGLEDAISAFNLEYLKTHTPRQLADYFYSRPFDHRDKAGRAVIRMHIIDAYQKHLNSLPRPNEERDAKAMIETLFTELQRDFKLEVLSNFILVKLGDYLRLETKTPEAARVYYEEALSRTDDTSYLHAARLGIAKLNATGTPGQKKRAIEILKPIIEEADDFSARERALYLTALLHSDLGSHGKAITAAQTYLAQNQLRQYKPACLMVLANSYQSTGRIEEALTTYQRIWMTSRLTSKYSVLAIPPVDGTFMAAKPTPWREERPTDCL